MSSYISLILDGIPYNQRKEFLNGQRARLMLPLAIFLAILAVSTSSIFIKEAQSDAPSLVIAAYRLTLASLALTPLALIKYRADLRSLTRRDLWLGLLSGFFLAIHFAAWISSLQYTTVASSIVLVSTSPLWVALFSPVVLRERVTRMAIAGMLLAMIGGGVVAISDACQWQDGLVCPSFKEFIQGRAVAGNILAVAGALAVTGYLLIGRKLRARMALVPYIFMVYGMAAIVMTFTMLAVGQSPFGYRPATYGWMVLLALIPQLIGHSTYNWALSYIPASLVALATLGEPIGSILLAYFFLQEIPAGMKIAGGILILAGIYIASRTEKL